MMESKLVESFNTSLSDLQEVPHESRADLFQTLSQCSFNNVLSGTCMLAERGNFYSNRGKEPSSPGLFLNATMQNHRD